MAKTLDDQVSELSKEVAKLSRLNAMKDVKIGQQQRALAELQRKINALSGQVAQLSTQLSRQR